MSNKLSTKIATIDFKKIMANALKRSRWSDKWVLFDGYGVYIVMNVSSIDVRNNKLSLQLRIDQIEYNDAYDTKISQSTDWTIITLSMSDEHYNVNTMINGIKGSVTRMITTNYRSFARNTEEFRAARKIDDQIHIDAREAAIDKLDDLGITDESIRDAYADDCESSAYTTQNEDEVKTSYRTDHRDSLIALVVSSLQFAER